MNAEEALQSLNERLLRTEGAIFALSNTIALMATALDAVGSLDCDDYNRAVNGLRMTIPERGADAATTMFFEGARATLTGLGIGDNPKVPMLRVINGGKN